MKGEPSQHPLARRPKLDGDHTPVRTLLSAGDHALVNQPVDELDRAVMAQLQPLREPANSGRMLPFQTLDLQQQEVLLRLDARRSGCGLPAPQKLPDGIPELGERPVVQLRASLTSRSQVVHNRGKYIASRYTDQVA